MAYYAVIFTSEWKSDSGYEEMAGQMLARARQMPGFLGLDTARATDGKGITVSYWRSLEDIQRWKVEPSHLEAQRRGRQEWYASYQVRVAKLEGDYA